jgi:hypothetical protein
VLPVWNEGNVCKMPSFSLQGVFACCGCSCMAGVHDCCVCASVVQLLCVAACGTVAECSCMAGVDGCCVCASVVQLVVPMPKPPPTVPIRFAFNSRPSLPHLNAEGLTLGGASSDMARMVAEQDVSGGKEAGVCVCVWCVCTCVCVRVSM